MARSGKFGYIHVVDSLGLVPSETGCQVHTQHGFIGGSYSPSKYQQCPIEGGYAGLGRKLYRGGGGGTWLETWESWSRRSELKTPNIFLSGRKAHVHVGHMAMAPIFKVRFEKQGC